MITVKQSKFFTNERKFILKMLAITLMINTIATSLLMVRNFFTDFLALIIFFFTYLILPNLASEKRDIFPKITDDKQLYFNSDSEDITDKMPQEKYFFLYFILLSVYSYFLFNFIDNGLSSISSRLNINDTLLAITGGSLCFSTPLIVLYSYSFIKDLPVIFFYHLFTKGSGSYSDSSSNRHYQFSSSHTMRHSDNSRFYYNPGYSSLPGNIHHKRH